MPDYRKEAARIAREQGVPEDLFLKLVGQESGFRPNAVSRAGAIGLAQLMPGTAQGLGVDPFDPIQNLTGGARYLKQQFGRFGRWDLALAAYNAGPGAVQKHGGIPPFRETQSYVKKIMGGTVPKAPSPSFALSPPLDTPSPPTGLPPAVTGILDRNAQLLGVPSIAPLLTKFAVPTQAPAAPLPTQTPALPAGMQPVQEQTRGGASLDQLLTSLGLADAVTSGDRPGAVTARGGSSDHGRPGKARDVNHRDPDFPKLVAHARANPSAYKDFIYSGLPWFIDEGRLYPISQLNKTDRDNHRDHAHISIR